MPQHLCLGNVTIELRVEGERFLGLGEISIGTRLIRSGELPIRPFTQTLDGLDYDAYEIESIANNGNRVVIRTRALATASAVEARLDHSCDPIWSTRPWDHRVLATDRMDWILEKTTRTIDGRQYDGFTYQFRFSSRRNSIWYIIDRATWELGGKASGVTLLRQQAGGDPWVDMKKSTKYSTAAWIGFPLNPVMTHDLPRWASEQGFDYQYRGRDALIGMFDRTGLIRTVVQHDPGDAAIRHCDKHIFDADRKARTTLKFIGLARGIGDSTDHLNAWTRVFDADQDNVLGEFGMHRPLIQTCVSHNFWHSFTCDSYRDELLPAAAALGVQKVFIDPVWENDMTKQRRGQLSSPMYGNMCCPHEYEVADVLGGAEGYRKLAEDALKLGIELQSWIGSHQSIHSPLLKSFDGPHSNEIIRMADGRHWWKSGYDSILGMDLTASFGPMFRDAIIRGSKATGIRRYLYDSFYNFAFMPVNYYSPDPGDPRNAQKGTMRPHTQWRALLEIMAAWQHAGIEMVIESLGPWGQAQHGVQGAYDRDGAEALAYQCSVNIGYSVIPAPGTSKAKADGSAMTYYRFLANKAPLCLNLTGSEGVRVDQAGNSATLRQANLDYRNVLPMMHTRTILPGRTGVQWAPAKGKQRAVFCFERDVLPVAADTHVQDITTGKTVSCGTGGLRMVPLHTYILDPDRQK